MEKEFVPYELALRMKALGFDEPCFSFYMGGFKELGKIKYVNPNNVAETNVLAPTFSQAFRWFREKYNIEATVACFYNKRLGVPYEERQYHCHVIRDGITSKGPKYKTYEEAELACLDKLIEIVESKQRINRIIKDVQDGK